MRQSSTLPDRLQQHRMLRETTPPNFLDSSLEWRRIFSEIWGTFLLVVVAAGAGVVAAKSGGAVTVGHVVAPGQRGAPIGLLREETWNHLSL